MKAEFESIELINNEKRKRFELHYNGHFAFITYVKKEGVWLLEHTVAPQELRGTGTTKALTLKVFNFIKDKAEKMQPICSYLHGFVQKNPEWKVLVDEQYERYEDL